MAHQAFRQSDFPSSGTAENNLPKMVVAIDGPAGSGKTTLARAIAKRLGYTCLETGSLYRAVAYALIELGGKVDNVRDVRRETQFASKEAEGAFYDASKGAVLTSEALKEFHRKLGLPVPIQ